MAIVRSFIRGRIDGVGKMIQTFLLGSDQHRQAVVVTDPENLDDVQRVDATKGARVDLSNTGANAIPLNVIVVAGSVASVAVPASAGITVVSAVAGRLGVVLVTALGTDPLIIYDNAAAAAGTVIGIVPANADVGALYPFNLSAANGITVGGSANRPNVTIGYS
jgi:hypothetical protein